jgi:GNAT superfamily N-acetyltransferase
MDFHTAPKDPELQVASRTCLWAELPESEQHFLLRTWVGQHSRFNPARLEKIRRSVLSYLNRPGHFVTVLYFPCPDRPEAEWRIVGFGAASLSAIHFVYVRPPYRRLGLTAVLFPALPPHIACTHWAKWLPITGTWRHRGSVLEYVGAPGIPQPERPHVES